LNGDPPRDEHRRHLLTRVVPNECRANDSKGV
jgi:hypothetical protein